MNIKPVGNPKVTVTYEGAIVDDSGGCFVVVLELIGIVIFLFIIGVIR